MMKYLQQLVTMTLQMHTNKDGKLQLNCNSNSFNHKSKSLSSLLFSGLGVLSLVSLTFVLLSF